MRSRKATQVEYLCPGERSPISRCVHLGRLAACYAGCRQCPHREDVGTLSPRQVKRLQEMEGRGLAQGLFHAEGASGRCWNELSPATVGSIASAFGIWLRRTGDETAEFPEVVLGGDGGAQTPPLVAAAAEGLRWAGCNVVDIGAASAPCLTFAVEHLRTRAGLWLGSGQAGMMHLRFWTAEAGPLSAVPLSAAPLSAAPLSAAPLSAGPQILPSPLAGEGSGVRGQSGQITNLLLDGRLSAGGGLEAVRAIFEGSLDRPTRRLGALRRAQVEQAYLAEPAECYHAMRPLRLLVHTACGPLVVYLEKLTRRVACQVITSGQENRGADFTARVDEGGECCRLADERGAEVPGDRALLLLARHVLAQRPGAAIVLEQRTPAHVARDITALGGRAVFGGASRAEMYRTMLGAGAVFGGGPSGRCWYRRQDDRCAADALWTITLLVRLLSQSDRPLSAVLDDARPFD